MSVLALNGVTKHYPRNPVAAVEDLTLEVREGEILSVTGESGSGKTTLLRLIAGLEVPDEGVISVKGTPVFEPGRKSVPPERRGVGMVFQNYALFPHLTIRENVLYGLNRAKRAERETVLERVLELTGLRGFEKRYPHEVSGGQQQRVALARALAPQPGIILLDEPFSNLDVSLRHQLREDVGAILRAARMTALLVTHDTRDALAVSDRVAVMKGGRLQQLGTPREVYTSPVNEVTALLFGRMNFVPPGVFSTRSGAWWVRPEDLELLLSPAPPEPISGNVVRSHFFGDRQEVVVNCSGPGGSCEMVVLTDPALPVRPGQTVGLRERAAASFDLPEPVSANS